MSQICIVLCFIILIRTAQNVYCENLNLNMSSKTQNFTLEYRFSVTDSESIVFKRVASVSIEECTDACEHRSACKAVVYHRPSLVCNLLTTFSETSIKKKRGIVLVEGFSEMAIGSSEAEDNQTECDVSESFFEMVGDIHGVGSSVLFDGKDNGIDLVRVCEENGQLSSIRKGLHFGTNALSSAGDCSDVTGPSGIYWVPHTNRPIFCDMDTEDGPWMVFQRRENGSVDFYRNWENYTNGFGSIGGEFWMGLHTLYEVCAADKHVCQLRIDMIAFNGSKGYATYEQFSIESSDSNYRLHVYGYHGNVGGNSLSWHNGKQFTTFDRDNDEEANNNCAKMYTGAWWYAFCHHSNLNGKYSHCGSRCEYGMNIVWNHWLGQYATLTRTEMKIRRR